MKNELQIFNFKDSAVRIVQKDGNYYWVLKDVCGILKIGNSRMVANRLDADEKADVSITDVSSNGVVQSRSMMVVNESGLYNAIFLSRTPDAKTFRCWVTHEVLPAIRKQGAYAIEAWERTPAYIAPLVRHLEAMEERIRGLEESSAPPMPREEGKAFLDWVAGTGDRHKAAMVEAVEKAVAPPAPAKGYVTSTELAASLGMSVHAFPAALTDKKIIYKKCGYWHLPYKHAHKGYLVPAVAGKSHNQTRWTPAGADYVRGRLGGEGK